MRLIASRSELLSGGTKRLSWDRMRTFAETGWGGFVCCQPQAVIGAPLR